MGFCNFAHASTVPKTQRIDCKTKATHVRKTCCTCSAETGGHGNEQ